MRPYRIGLLGYGFIGKVHAYAIRNLPLFYDLPAKATVAHVATSSEGSAGVAGAQLRELFDQEVTESVGYEALMEDDRLDIIAICTPNSLHRDPVMAALAAGKAVYCDKPLTESVASAEAIASAAEENGVADRLGMVFQNRFFPATMRAKELIDAGALGTLLSYRAGYLHSGNASPETPFKWKLDAGQGGGVIADLGSHLIDLLQWLIGPIDSVQAQTQIAYGERPAPTDREQRLSVTGEDAFYAIGTARGPEGEVVKGTMEASKLALGTEDELRLEIHGNQGALRFNLMQPNYMELYRPGRQAAADGPRLEGGWQRLDTVQRYTVPASGFPGPKNSIGWLRAHAANFAAFLQAIDSREPPEPGLPAAMSVQRVMDALGRSADRGDLITLSRPVTLP